MKRFAPLYVAESLSERGRPARTSTGRAGGTPALRPVVNRLAPLLLIVAAASGCSLFNKPSSGTETLAELDSLPVGVEVTLPAYSIRAYDDGPKAEKGKRYVWTYRPTVQAKTGALTVVNFGVCYWQDNQWVLSDFDQSRDADEAIDDFDDDFDCPNGRLLPGKSYVGAQEESSDTLEPRRLKWFVIAEDKDGNRWKGEVEIELLAELESGK
jgi:hypothetical protein